MDSNEYENNHLVELGDSNYEIVDGEPDILGWEVKNEHGLKIGDVDELLFDTESRKVRYIIVDLDDNDLELDDDKKVLIPIGIAEIYSNDEAEDEDEDYEEVEDEGEEDESVLDKDDHGLNDFDEDEADETVVKNEPTDTDLIGDDDEENQIYSPADDGDVVIVPVTIEQLRQLPAYDKDNVTAEAESEIMRVFEAGSSGTSQAMPYNREDFYAHEHFNAGNYYGGKAASETVYPDSPTHENFPDNMAPQAGSANSDLNKNTADETGESDGPAAL